jgi:hypothetical protein
MKPFRSFAILAAIFTYSPASAAGMTTLMVLRGTCIKVVAMNIDSDVKFCDSKLSHIELPNARLGFQFLLEKPGDRRAVVVSFFGDGKKQVKPNPDSAVMPIDRVRFTFNGGTDDLVAVGSCRFANPYKGTPVTISCSADTTQGQFVGEFITNGSAPDLKQVR